MAKAIIDRFKAIEIEIDQTGGRIEPLGKGDDPLQFTYKGAAIEDWR